MNKDFILYLYSQPGTVFTIDEIAQLFPDFSYESLRDRLYYYTKTGKLKKPHHGIYAKEEYDYLELANKLYKPSYISLETVLSKKGVVFQYYETIFVVSYLTRLVNLPDATIQLRQIKGSVLTNTEGIEKEDGYFVASLERAFLDAVYIYKNYHFDNLGAIKWEKVSELVKIYHNKSFEKRVEDYVKY